MKNNVLACLMIGVMGMAVVSGCGALGAGGSSEPSVSGRAAQEEDFEREFRDLTLGTVEASGSAPESFVFLNDSAFSFEIFEGGEFAGVCGRTDEGEQKNSYSVTLKSATEFSYEEFDAKLKAVWDYWESLGMEPGYFRPSETSMSIRAQTPLGGEASYSAGKYGEQLAVQSLCTEKIASPPYVPYVPPKSSDTPDF